MSEPSFGKLYPRDYLANRTIITRIEASCEVDLLNRTKKLKSNTDQILIYLYLYLFYLININININIIEISNFISISILNIYEYNLDIKIMNIIIDKN